jgi:hypothetical protein
MRSLESSAPTARKLTADAKRQVSTNSGQLHRGRLGSAGNLLEKAEPSDDAASRIFKANQIKSRCK